MHGPDAEQSGRRQKRSAEDAIDLNRELTEDESGNPYRLLSESERPKARRKREQRRELEIQILVAQQSEITRFSERLLELERTSIRAMQEAETRLEAGERALAEIRARPCAMMKDTLSTEPPTGPPPSMTMPSS